VVNGHTDAVMAAVACQHSVGAFAACVEICIRSFTSVWCMQCVALT
jgi:hypothetical protein